MASTSFENLFHNFWIQLHNVTTLEINDEKWKLNQPEEEWETDDGMSRVG